MKNESSKDENTQAQTEVSECLSFNLSWNSYDSHIHYSCKIFQNDLVLRKSLSRVLFHDLLYLQNKD